MNTGGKSSGAGASGGPTEPAAASTTTAEPLLVGVICVAAIQDVAAAKGSDAGSGGYIGAYVTKAQELDSPQKEECVVGVVPEAELEEDAASRAMHNAPGAEYAIGGGMTIGCQSSGVGANGGSTEPTSASLTTAEQAFLRQAL